MCLKDFERSHQASIFYRIDVFEFSASYKDKDEKQIKIVATESSSMQSPITKNIIAKCLKEVH